MTQCQKCKLVLKAQEQSYKSYIFFHFIFLQGAELQKQQQESQAARLADLELLLKALSAKTEVCTAGLLFCHYELIKEH